MKNTIGIVLIYSNIDTLKLEITNLHDMVLSFHTHEVSMNDKLDIVFFFWINEDCIKLHVVVLILGAECYNRNPFEMGKNYKINHTM